MENKVNKSAKHVQSYRLTVISVGDATSAATKVIASGLNLPTEKVAEKLYRAPSVLAENLTETMSQQLAALIAKLGVDVKTELDEAPPPPPSELFDISVQISEIEHLPKVIQHLSPFLGVDEATVISLLVTPPAIILGSVSTATISAIRKHLNFSGVNIIASRPLTAKYDLISGTISNIQKQQLNQFLARLNLSLIANEGLCLANLDYATAQSIWKHFGHNLPIKIVNQDFYRYDLLINSLPSPHQTTAQKYLEESIGISPEDYPSVQAHLPLVIHESISHQDALTLESECVTHGLQITKINITFQRLKIHIHTAQDIPPVDTLLQQLGLIDTPIKKLPYITRDTSETFARFAKHLLERNGAEVSYQECTV